MNNRTAKDDSLIVVLGIAYEMYKRGIKFLPVDIMSRMRQHLLLSRWT